MFKLPSQIVQRDAATDIPTAGMSGLDSALPFVGAGLGVLQAGIGIVQQANAKKKINGLLGEEQPFQTSQQVYDILNATLNNAQGDTTTRNYQTNQVNQALSNSLGVASKLGANPNDLSSLFQQSLNGIMQVGEQYHQSNTAAFSNVLNAYKLVSDNKDAEYASKQNMIKDKLAAQGVNLGAGAANTSGGVNALLGSLSAKATGDLFKQQKNNNQSLSDMINAMLATKTQAGFSTSNQQALTNPLTFLDAGE